jgi:hypothetical protein
MTNILVNYKKRKNSHLFNAFQTNNSLTNVQNYIPIYDRFFSLNNTNWNSINLNNVWALADIKPLNKTELNENIFIAKLKHSNDDNELTKNEKVFIKIAPLLDPFKYLVGKYNHHDTNLFNLPSFDKHNNATVHTKINDINNSSYVDSFFSYLTSQVLNCHTFIHGIDYFGSFLAIKNNYKLNIIDDIDYLIESEYFNKYKNNLFTVEDYSHLILNEQPIKLKPLKISNTFNSNLSVKSINDEMFEELFDINDISDVTTICNSSSNVCDLIDMSNSKEFNIHQHKSKTLRSNSTCSSRTSHTNSHDNDDNDDNVDKNSVNDSDSDINDDDINDDDINDDDINDDDINDDDINDDDINDDVNDEETEYEDIDSDEDTDNCEEEQLFATFPKFPVQLICMELCENTLDSLIVSETLSEDEWFSALMQIIMTLITYQKMFSFTHNDLHTNNIMYVSTNQKFIYYTYNKKTYKVPTFGKVFKIIDFGRAIYKFNGQIFCSDSFQLGGDAATQYNTEPYFNDKKPRLDPNFSFDLCRLACSIFDYVVEDFDTIKNGTPLIKLIVEWCIDDNGINVLYKNTGVERYPDFKLYKMITRHVHNHSPQAQLERPEFSKYVISNKTVPKSAHIINIDEFPCYC